MNIHVPAPELQSGTIAITGLTAHLDRAKAGLLERVRELQAEQEDRVSACPAAPPAIKSGVPSCSQQPEVLLLGAQPLLVSSTTATS